MTGDGVISNHGMACWRARYTVRGFFGEDDDFVYLPYRTVITADPLG